MEQNICPPGSPVQVVLPLLVVDNSINLCKYTAGWFFRHEAVRTGHLILE